MSRTQQQQEAITLALDPTNHLIKIQACAGAGKTHTLIELVKELKPTTGLYLAYNKAIATEATAKFKGTNVKCSTIHALAYKYVVSPYGLQVGFFNARDVHEDIRYIEKRNIVDTMDSFFLSAELDPTIYATAMLPKHLQPIFLDYLDKMANGAIKCTHSFYLKLFHIYLASGEIKIPEVDILLLDEFGDITELTLEIFKLLPAKTKVAVGDPMQNIYSFNKTINGFTALKDVGIEVEMTQSFRVSAKVAKSIQSFTQNHCDKNFKFVGNKDAVECEFPTYAYISRTNAGLLGKMFELMEQLQCFHVTRDISTILKTPLVLIDILNNKPVNDYEFKHLEAARTAYSKSAKDRSEHPTIGKYLESKYKDDAEIMQGLKLVYKHGRADIMALEKYVKKAAKLPSNFTLTTSHSAKG